MGRLIHTRDNELLVISFLGAAVLVAGVSEVLGVADAIGAFMVGLILAGTPSGPRIRELVHPLRDAFAAIFFFAFGLAIDPGDLASVAGPVAAAAALTVVMNIVAGLCVARVYHYGSEPAAEIATTLVARGEFALILAAMAAGADSTPSSLPSSPDTCSCLPSSAPSSRDVPTSSPPRCEPSADSCRGPGHR